jgi:hypothetical protein
MSDNIESMNKERKYPKEQEVLNRIMDVIDDYAGEVSLVSVLGVLRLIETSLISAEAESRSSD